MLDPQINLIFEYEKFEKDMLWTDIWPSRVHTTKSDPVANIQFYGQRPSPLGFIPPKGTLN